MWFYNIYKFLPKKFKARLFIVVFLMIIGTLFETLGIAMVLPLMTVLSEAEKIYQYTSLVNFINYFNLNIENILIYGVFAFGFLYFVKTIFLSIQSWYILIFSFNIQAYFAEKLITNYLSSPYEFHLKKNSSTLIRNITAESDSFAGIIVAITTLLLEIFVTVSIMSVLIYLRPGIVFIILLIVVPLGIIYVFFTKNKILKWGKDRQLYEGERLKNINQSLGGIKEIIFYQVKNKFINDFKRSNNNTITSQVKSDLIKKVSPYFIEFIVLLIFILIIIYYLTVSMELSSLLPSLTLFAVSFFRILPSINRINNCWQGLRFSKVSADLIIKEINDTNNLIYSQKKFDHPLNTMKGDIIINNINFSYDSGKNILDKLSINFKYGEFIGIIGTTGNGKTTFVDILLGLLDKKTGQIKIDNLMLDNLDNIENNLKWQKSLGYASQHIYLCDDTIKSNIAFGIDEDNVSNSRINECIEIAQLTTFIDELDYGIETRIGERGVRLSGGQRQRIGIARALYNDPNYLILDEATSALDYDTENKIISSLIKYKNIKTIIFISHRKSSLINCDNIYELKNGKINII